MSIEIEDLKKYPDYAPILAHWTFDEWYKDRDIDFSIIVKSYRARLTSDKPPLSYIALWNRFPVGMVTLRERELSSRKDIGPWLSSLYVIPGRRKTGIGSMLAAYLTRQASILGHERLYLFLGRTDQDYLAGYYARREWLYLSDGIDNDGYPTKIFFRNLQGPL